MEILNVYHSGIEPGIGLQKFSEGLRGYIAATRNRDMRMPGTKLRLEPRTKRRLLHSLVNLKQVRMRLTDADPNDFWRALCRKCSYANSQ
jgi:hypothetical protein